MTWQRNVFRAAGYVAMWLGYAAASMSRTVERVEAALWPMRHWRPVQVGPLQVQVPSSWGDLEPDPQGGFVIHGRKREYRVDGDAVWYSSAVELRVRTSDAKTRPSNEPMSETCRSITTDSGVMVLAMAIANGVGRKRRREAMRVLKSARVVRETGWG